MRFDLGAGGYRTHFQGLADVAFNIAQLAPIQRMNQGDGGARLASPSSPPGPVDKVFQTIG